MLISLTADPAATPVLAWVRGQLRVPVSAKFRRPDRRVAAAVTPHRMRGGVAGRRTDPDTVHLVSAAATPLGGDTISIRVVVEAGARLRVRTAAATVAMPGATTTESHALWTSRWPAARRRPAADHRRRGRPGM